MSERSSISCRQGLEDRTAEVTLFRSPHIQTVWAPLLRRPPMVIRALQKLPLEDGDHLWLHWAGPDPDMASAIVVLLHGLAGSSDSPYIVGLQHALSQQGVASVAMNARGAGGRPNDRARTYHAGETDDVRFVLDHLQRRFSQASLLPVGYSLGGSRLLNLLAEGGHAAVPAAVSVCVPLWLADCEARLNRGFSRVYRNRLIRELIRSFREKLPHLERHAPAEAARLRALDLTAIRTFRDYDNRVVCPLFGFADADDYYNRCSAGPKLARIHTPTLVIQAEDDPFMTPAGLPAPGQFGEAVNLEVRGGGHVGFVEGLPWRPRYWLEERIPRFLQPWLQAPRALSA